MRAVYFDCFAGVSGDMIIGALLDLGVELEQLQQQLSSLRLAGFQITSKRVQRGGIASTKFEVQIDLSDHSARSLSDIRSIIGESRVSDQIKIRAIRAFERLAEAEARIHGATLERVHFHEVGAVDSIIDTVGAMIGFELLGAERFFCSSMRVGSGFINSEHGRMPVPAPATAELLRGVPVYGGELEGEFVTPTGAAIVTTLCETFGPLTRMKVTGVGYGAGSRDPVGFPNALRLVVGEIDDETGGRDETIVVLETNIDDMNPQVYGFIMERAFALGALDVFTVPAQMKKDRPGVLLTVLCKPEDVNPMMEMLLSETTTLGVRYHETKRRVLERLIETVETDYGPVRIKVARLGGRTLHFQPEYDDCARLAGEKGAPLLEVQAAARAAYLVKLKVDKASG